MSRCFVFVAAIAVVTVPLLVVVAACSSGGGGGVTTAQATTAMQTVIGGVNLMQNRSSSWTVVGASSPYAVSFSTAGLSMTGTKTTVGINDNLVLAITFTNYSDAATGYTLNGTLNYTVNGGAPTTGSLTGNLTLSGGPVAKAVWDVGFSSPGPVAAPTFTGTVTCNGTAFDPSTLSLNATTEAAMAVNAMIDGMYAVWGSGSWNISGNDVSWSTTGLSMTGTDTTVGNIETAVLTFTYTNYASAHVYAVSGTVNQTQITDTSSNTFSSTVSYNLTLTGGPVVTITATSMTSSGTANPHQASPLSGIFMCNGTAFDGKTMPLF